MALWFWAGDSDSHHQQDTWVPYDAATNAKLEKAYVSGKAPEEVKLDRERFVDMSDCSNMVQRRFDAPTRHRKVKREAPPEEPTSVARSSRGSTTEAIRPKATAKAAIAVVEADDEVEIPLALAADPEDDEDAAAAPAPAARVRPKIRGKPKAVPAPAPSAPPRATDVPEKKPASANGGAAKGSAAGKGQGRKGAPKPMEVDDDADAKNDDDEEEEEKGDEEEEKEKPAGRKRPVPRGKPKVVSSGAPAQAPAKRQGASSERGTGPTKKAKQSGALAGNQQVSCTGPPVDWKKVVSPSVPNIKTLGRNEFLTGPSWLRWSPSSYVHARTPADIRLSTVSLLALHMLRSCQLTRISLELVCYTIEALAAIQEPRVVTLTTPRQLSLEFLRSELADEELYPMRHSAKERDGSGDGESDGDGEASARPAVGRIAALRLAPSPDGALCMLLGGAVLVVDTLSGRRLATLVLPETFALPEMERGGEEVNSATDGDYLCGGVACADGRVFAAGTASDDGCLMVVAWRYHGCHISANHDASAKASPVLGSARVPRPGGVGGEMRVYGCVADGGRLYVLTHTGGDAEKGSASGDGKDGYGRNHGVTEVHVLRMADLAVQGRARLNGFVPSGIAIADGELLVGEYWRGDDLDYGHSIYIFSLPITCGSIEPLDSERAIYREFGVLWSQGHSVAHGMVFMTGGDGECPQDADALCVWVFPPNSGGEVDMKAPFTHCGSIRAMCATGYGEVVVATRRHGVFVYDLWGATRPVVAKAYAR